MLLLMGGEGSEDEMKEIKGDQREEGIKETIKTPK